MKANIIIADCPWSTNDELTMSNVARGAEANYSTMPTNDICNLPVKNIADQNGCVLCLWVLGSMLEDGMKVMKAWGFEQKQIYVWVKTKNKSSIKKWLDKSLNKVINKITTTDNLVNDLLGDQLLAFYMGRLFRQTHEICLIGTVGKVYKDLKNKSQRSVCFAENIEHSTKPEKLQNSLDIMFPIDKNLPNRIELFGRRQRENWIVVGNEAPMSLKEDILISLDKLKNISDKNLEDIGKILFPAKSKELLEFWDKLNDQNVIA